MGTGLLESEIIYGLSLEENMNTCKEFRGSHISQEDKELAKFKNLGFLFL